jgi:hypothetical protein
MFLLRGQKTTATTGRCFPFLIGGTGHVSRAASSPLWSPFFQGVPDWASLRRVSSSSFPLDGLVGKLGGLHERMRFRARWSAICSSRWPVATVSASPASTRWPRNVAKLGHSAPVCRECVFRRCATRDMSVERRVAVFAFLHMLSDAEGRGRIWSSVSMTRNKRCSSSSGTRCTAPFRAAVNRRIQPLLPQEIRGRDARRRHCQ